MFSGNSLDLHTGLGPSGTYKLLTSPYPNSEHLHRLHQWFSPDVIESSDSSGTAYPIRGGLGDWCRNRFPQCQYDLLTAEFGTYGGLKVVAALRAENQAYWWGNNSPKHIWTKQQLKEVFAPENPQWRAQVIPQAISVIKQACLMT